MNELSDVKSPWGKGLHNLDNYLSLQSGIYVWTNTLTSYFGDNKVQGLNCKHSKLNLLLKIYL